MKGYEISLITFWTDLECVYIAVPTEKNWGNTTVFPKFCDFCPNLNFSVGLLYGYEKKFCPKPKKGLHFDSVSDFSIFVPKS